MTAVSRLARVTDLGRRYVDSGRLPGVHVLVSHRGRDLVNDCYGQADVSAGAPLREDSIYRMFSLSKLITTVTFLTLYEEGEFLLEDPVSRYIPGFASLGVYSGGGVDDPHTVPASREITLYDLLTCTSGLTGASLNKGPVEELYARERVRLGSVQFHADDEPEGPTGLAGFTERLCAMPLRFDPGTRWAYGASMDVIGHLIELITAKPLDQALHERVLDPLGMVDTGFVVPGPDRERLPTLYRFGDAGELMVEADPSATSRYLRSPTFLAGGAGMVSTAHDYSRLLALMLGGGESAGVRLLARKTVELMTMNHLPGGGDLNDLDQGTFSRLIDASGFGFGFGCGVLTDLRRAKMLGSVGEYFWMGASGVFFWVDPAEELTVLFLTQFMNLAAETRSYPIRRELQRAVYQAIS